MNTSTCFYNQSTENLAPLNTDQLDLVHGGSMTMNLASGWTGTVAGFGTGIVIGGARGALVGGLVGFALGAAIGGAYYLATNRSGASTKPVRNTTNH